MAQTRSDVKSDFNEYWPWVKSRQLWSVLIDGLPCVDGSTQVGRAGWLVTMSDVWNEEKEKTDLGLDNINS